MDRSAATGHWLTRHDGSFGPPQHWYFISTRYCPLCGHEEVTRERRYGKRPSNNQRREFIEYWDGCGV